MVDETAIRVTIPRLTRAALMVAFGPGLLPNATGCIAYRIYSGVKTVEKVKDFTEDHILKSDDEKDKDKDKDQNQ